MDYIFTPGYYTGDNYQFYLKTQHWRNLKELHIYSNPHAKCWICGFTDKKDLLLHHERYDNLFHEKLEKDVFILCKDCHTEVHFFKKMFFLKRKTKLIRRELRYRRLSLKISFCIRNRQYKNLAWYLLVRNVS